MNWIAGSIRNKILAVFALGLVLVVAGALYGFAAARSGLATVARVNDTLLAQSIDTQALEGAFKEQVQQWMSVLVRGYDEKAMDKAWKQFTFREREVRRTAEKLHDVVALPAAKELLGKFIADHKQMGVKYREGFEAFKASNFDAKKVDASLKGIESGPAEELEDLVKLMRDEAQKAVADARAEANRALAFSLGVIGLATLMALVACAWLIMRTVVRPLKHAVGVVDRVASGDLTVEVKSDSTDETGRLLSGLATMRAELAVAVSRIRRSADGVGHASKELAAGHADLSSRTDEQAASLEQTAASMEELATTVKHNAESAREANALAAGTSRTAGKGGEEMAQVVGTMGGISDAARKIADILTVIDGIAFQTNILALNAAVEAARAGEQGRGFAVVAAEVRALAQRSAGAAKEIKELIQNSVHRVDEGKRLVERAGATMEEIVTSVQRVTEMMSGIAAASKEQLSGIEQVSNAVTQMDKVVQQNASLVAESSAAAQHMAVQADELMSSVARFRLEEAEPVLEDQPLAASLELPTRAPIPMRLSKKVLPVVAFTVLASLLPGRSDAADGATIADQQCAMCHGKNGVSSEPTIPTIAGYSAKYLVESMKNFRKKQRSCAEVAIVSGPKKGQKSDMCKVLADVSDADADAVAKFFAAQKFVRAKQPFDAAKAQKGAAVYKLRCEKCHEDNGASPDEDNGILAGQWMPYMRDQLVGFRTGKRPIDDKMKQRLDRVNKDDEELLLHFFASQQ